MLYFFGPNTFRLANGARPRPRLSLMRIRPLVSTRRPLLGALAGLSVWLTAIAPSWAESESSDAESERITLAPANGAGVSLREMKGRSLRSSDGASIGTIADFIVDLDSGRALYTVVAVGGFWGFDVTLYIVPTPALRPANAGGGYIVAIDKGRWAQVPKINQDDFNADRLKLSLADEQIIEALFSHSILGTDRSFNEFPVIERPMRASKIWGKAIQSAGSYVGKITDVICASDHDDTAAALLEPNTAFTGSARAFLVPLAKLRIESPTEDPILAMLLPSDFQPAVAPANSAR